ncbi:carbohydrate-binding protein [Actinacidiphila glaucinigra]|uniref:carbohydrate-binding protein n=1 Tax=Actinacidiphila glaucinigra TaxID=235986 RepID=UPI002DDBF36F|nr:carbohydrate-binding protein [Actinacidiphila glaucinigra]WSD57618.1 carbohydrate-binding protein [Actinacidiphila glaucinigra]
MGMIFKRSALALMTATAAIALTVTLPAPAQAAGSTHYVSPAGSDTNPGTSGSPFRTVQKCAATAVAGDTCVIASGTYRETVTPAHSGTPSARITFRAADGANVVIDGSDPVTNWSAVSASDLSALQAADPFLTGTEFSSAAASGRIFRASVVLNASLPGNQVFVDGGMLGEAQWPYPGNNPTRPVHYSADAGTTTTLYDSELTQPAGFWTGATLTSHNWFVSETGTVTASGPGSVTAAGLPSCVGLGPNQQNLYSLSGKLEALSHPGQWFYDATAHQLYLWTADGGNPGSHAVEAKQRNVAINLSGRSYISVVGLGIRAATAQTSATSTGNVFDGIRADYVSHSMDLDVDPNKVTPTDACDVLTAGETTTGILLRGTSNTLRNSTVDHSSGNGVLIAGSGNVVTNNRITNVDYRGSYAAGINILGTDQTVTHNTVANSGRSDINIDNKVAGTIASGHDISYNDLSDYGNLVVDVGAIYICCNVNLAGTTIHHNLLHDAAPLAASAPAPGVYLDLSTYNATVHNNVAWNGTTYGVVLINPNGGSTSGNKIYNNTSGTDPKSVSLFGGTYTTTEVANNIGDADTAAGVTSSSNLAHTTNPLFTNPTALDFSLTSSSPARGAAVVRPPATDGYTDPAPSIGAYQYGVPTWQGGTRMARAIVQGESYTSSSGVSTHSAGTGTVMGSFDGGDWAQYGGVDFGSGRNLFSASIGSELPYSGGRFEIRIDSLTGPVIGTVTVENTGGFDTFLTKTVPITLTSGTHDVYLKALGTGPGVANIDHFSVERIASQVEAESANASSGTTVATGGTGKVAGSFDGGDSLTFRSVDFGTGRTVFAANLAVDPAYAGQSFAVRLGSCSGTTVGTMTVASTGGWSAYRTQSTPIAPTSGVHDVVLVALGNRAGVANVDWFSFE